MKVVDNLQVFVERVHIRYEDEGSEESTPFSAGLTLELLHAQSTDPHWQPSFLSVSQALLHKVGISYNTTLFCLFLLLIACDAQKCRRLFQYWQGQRLAIAVSQYGRMAGRDGRPGPPLLNIEQALKYLDSARRELSASVRAQTSLRRAQGAPRHWAVHCRTPENVLLAQLQRNRIRRRSCPIFANARTRGNGSGERGERQVRPQSA